ncbi:MAG TPA: 50S ribosomal protein L24 [Thermoanaerobaculia bacterium]|nr:50S ribosomal protein L24 [Thermoanaerobaculia bacterium]
MKKSRIKKGDQVLVIAGKDRGAKGRVLRLLVSKSMAIVERVNLHKRHTRQNPQKGIQGGILEKEAPVHLSNLMVLDPQSGKPTRIGRVRHADGTSSRVAKKSGATIG